MKNSWILLPLAVIAFIVLSAGWVFDASRWQQATVNQAEVEEQQAQIEQLQQKLQVLSSVDTARDEEDLKYLNTAVPTTKMIWYVVSQLKVAADEAGATVDEYEAVVGTGVSEATEGAKLVAGEELKIEATLTLDDPKNLAILLASLENRLPLVKLDKLDYTAGQLNIELVSAYAPNKKVTAGAGGLPDYRDKVEKAKTKLQGLVSFGEVEVAPAGEEETNSVNVNPF